MTTHSDHLLGLLDEIRSIAQLGLQYSTNDYDSMRYNRLLQLASVEYSKICGLETHEIKNRFINELGYITPKVGVNAFITSEDGSILLEKRADDGLWGIPGGWAEIGESPQLSLKRELLEEAGLEIEVNEIIDIFTRLPGMYGQPHTSYHILFRCRILSGEITKSLESEELGFYDRKQIKDWHRDHYEMVKSATFW